MGDIQQVVTVPKVLVTYELSLTELVAVIDAFGYDNKISNIKMIFEGKFGHFSHEGFVAHAGLRASKNMYESVEANRLGEGNPDDLVESYWRFLADVTITSIASPYSTI